MKAMSQNPKFSLQELLFDRSEAVKISLIQQRAILLNDAVSNYLNLFL